MAIRLLYRLLLQQLTERQPAPAATRAAPLPVTDGGSRATATSRRAALLALATLAALAGILALHLMDSPTLRPDQELAMAELRLEIPALSAAPAVVYLSGPGLEPLAPARDAAAALPRITSLNAAFTPSFQVLAPGSAIEAINGDRVPHNTHVFNGGETVFNVALPLEGVSVRKTVTGTGIFSVRCDLHPWMQAWLFVPPSRHHATVHQPGTVVFTGVAPGEVLLHLWQPGHTESIHRLSLSPGAVRTLRLR